MVFGILLLASMATRSLTALLDFMCAVYRRNKYWWRPHGYMMELINGANLRAYGIMGLRIVYHGKFSGQERAVRMIRTWGLNPCLRNSLLKCVYVEKQCTSRHGITHVHI